MNNPDTIHHFNKTIDKYLEIKERIMKAMAELQVALDIINKEKQNEDYSNQ